MFKKIRIARSYHGRVWQLGVLMECTHMCSGVTRPLKELYAKKAYTLVHSNIESLPNMIFMLGSVVAERDARPEIPITAYSRMCVKRQNK